MQIDFNAQSATVSPCSNGQINISATMKDIEHAGLLETMIDEMKQADRESLFEKYGFVPDPGE